MLVPMSLPDRKFNNVVFPQPIFNNQKFHLILVVHFKNLIYNLQSIFSLELNQYSFHRVSRFKTF